MRLVWFIVVLGFLLIGCDTRQQDAPANVQVKEFVLSQIDSMTASIDSLYSARFRDKDALAQARFVDARLAYKKIESIVEFYFPGAGKAINGPAIDKADEHDDKVNYATGFQIVEEYLYPSINKDDKAAALAEIQILKSCAIRVRSLMIGTTLSDKNIFQSCRLEVLRVLSLGISGFDSPVAFLSLAESRTALEGIERILSCYGKDESWEMVRAEFDKSKQYLLDHGKNFNDFDRAYFIVSHLNPLSKALYKFQKDVNVANNAWADAVNLSQDDFFTTTSYNIDFFTKPKGTTNNDSLVRLGKLLFFDPVLSGNNKRACASCHQPGKAFTDGRSKSMAFNFDGMIQRNAPTLINAGYQKSQFWDQRVNFLEDQVMDVVNNPKEMHHSLINAIGVLNASDEYKSMFANSFGKGTVVNDAMIRSALSTYIMSLQSFNSPFDKYMRGEKDALSEAQVRGFNLFMGKAKCGTCHFAPLFNGSTPPMYAETESEVLGVPDKPDTLNATLDNDLGKYHTYPRTFFKNAFKTPTVRNAAMTAPYMHNGVYDSLSQVIDFYNRGGGEGIGVTISNQTLPPDKLDLSKLEQREIIAFIEALSDTVNLTDTPKRLPSIKGHKLDRRKIGGEY